MMNRCDSLAVLVEHEQIAEYQTSDSDTDGTCSGYDSASDTLDDLGDQLLALPDLVSHAEPTSQSSKDDRKERMNFQSTNALCNHLKYIISMPELCDVKFLVGEEKFPIYGVKAIMSTRSRIFYHLIIKHQRKQEIESTTKRRKKRISIQHLHIEVKKYEPEVFRKIIEFVHCGSVDVSVDNVAGLLCGASQFGLEDLKSACWDFIDRCLQRESVNQILRSARKYSQHKITTRLLNKVNKHIAGMKTGSKQRATDTPV